MKGADLWEGFFPDSQRLDRPKIWQAAELVSAELARTTYFVEGLLPTGLTLLVSPAKVGKSFLVAGVTAAVAWGGRALGYLPTKQAAVLYLDLEQDAELAQGRWRKIFGQEHPPDLHIAFSWPRMPDGLRMIGEFLAEHPEVRVVVIDVLSAFWPMETGGGKKPGANAYHVEYEIVSQLRAFSMQKRIALILVHHTNRGQSTDPLDRISGTNAMAGVPHAIWFLSRQRKERVGRLYVTGRNVQEQEYQLEWWPAINGWSLVADEEMPR